MAQLVNIKKLAAGGDPYAVWSTVNELIDALNNLQVTFVPSGGGFAKLSDGQIQMDLSGFLTRAEARERIPTYAEGSDKQSGATDTGH